MEETPTSDNSINFNNLSNNDEKNTKDIDEIVIEKLMSTCEAVALTIVPFLFIFPIISILFYTPYKKAMFSFIKWIYIYLFLNKYFYNKLRAINSRS